jgi:hypothetical protein
VDFGNPEGGWRKIVFREVETGSVTGCVTHRQGVKKKMALGCI